MEEAAYSGAGLYSLDGGTWRASVVVVAPEPRWGRQGRTTLAHIRLWPLSLRSMCAHALLGRVFFYSSPKEDGQDLACCAAYRWAGFNVSSRLSAGGW